MIKTGAQKLRKRHASIFYGWWIVGISMVVDTLKHGTFTRGFTVYFLPIQQQLGVSRAALSLAETLGRLEGGLQGPLVGYLNDRIGPRLMMTAGGILSGLGFILLSFTHSYWYFLLIFIGLMSVGFRTGYNHASIPTVNRWFLRKKSLAMSLASMGRGLGGAVIYLMAYLVFSVGWRTAAMVSGIGIIVITVPLAQLVRRSPESMGLLPDGDTAPPNRRPGLLVRPGSARPNPAAAGPIAGPGFRAVQGSVDFTTREAMKTRSYWLFALAYGLNNAVNSGVYFHLVPLMVWAGTSQPKAALLVGLLSFGTLAFGPIMGWMGDSWSKPKINAVAMTAGVAAMLILLVSSGHLWQLALFALLLSMSESSNALAWAILGDFFGRRNYATTRGWLDLPDQLMSMSTPVWMGLIFDRTGSYFWAVVPLAVMYGLSAIFFFTLPRPRPPERYRRL